MTLRRKPRDGRLGSSSPAWLAASARRRGSGFDFREVVREELDRARDDLPARVERADAAVALATDPAALAEATIEAWRLRLAVLGRRAREVAEQSLMHVALGLSAYVKTAGLSLGDLDELIAAVDAADSSIEQER